MLKQRLRCIFTCDSVHASWFAIDKHKIDRAKFNNLWRHSLGVDAASTAWCCCCWLLCCSPLRTVFAFVITENVRGAVFWCSSHGCNYSSPLYLPSAPLELPSLLLLRHNNNTKHDQWPEHQHRIVSLLDQEKSDCSSDCAECRMQINVWQSRSAEIGTQATCQYWADFHTESTCSTLGGW